MFITANLCQYLGNNCFNLTELNLFAQGNLTPKNLCDILYSMKNLKILNLAHTQANHQVTKQISITCLKLEDLNLESCVKLYDDCIDDIISQVWLTLMYLNIDYIPVSETLVCKILLKCKKIRCFKTQYLAKIILNHAEKNSGQNIFQIDKIEIDSHVTLSSNMMEAITYTCPNLRSFQANCMAEKNSISFLNDFPVLTELTLANSSSIIIFKFKGHLMEALKNSIGRQLKSLSLISVDDVNLKTICCYCKSLQKLNVELIGFYDPSLDDYLDQNNNKITNFCIPNLTSLSISKTKNNRDQLVMNANMLVNDIFSIMDGGKVKFLEFNGLGELDNEFFIKLFSSHAMNSFENEHKMIHNNISSLDLKNLNNITADLVHNYLLQPNMISYINLDTCKLINRRDNVHFGNFVTSKKLNCVVKWS